MADWRFVGPSRSEAAERHIRVRYFRNPCDRDPLTGNFKKFKFFKNLQKLLNVYFWGTNVYFWDNRGFGGFGISFFVAGGFWGLCGSGGPVEGFENI